MKKLLLSIVALISFGAASFGQCVTATTSDYTADAASVSPSPIAVSATGTEATVTYTTANTYQSGLRWNFTSKDFSGLTASTNVSFEVKLGATPLTWSHDGTGTVGTCNTNGILNIWLIDHDYTYSTAFVVPVDLTSSYQNVTATVDMSASDFDESQVIGVIIFVGDPCGTTTGETYSGEFVVKNLSVGGDCGASTTGTTKAAELIHSSKLYPNPVSDLANVELNLKSSSDVKVTLTDMMGKEVAIIAEGSMASLNESFSVAGLVQGIYTVNYFVNGAPAKAELLMVK